MQKPTEGIKLSWKALQLKGAKVSLKGAEVTWRVNCSEAREKLFKNAALWNCISLRELIGTVLLIYLISSRSLNLTFSSSKIFLWLH